MSGISYGSQPQTVGDQIVRAASVALTQLVQARITNFKAFWSDPINIAAQLGTAATGVFNADADTAAFLGRQLTAAGAPADVIAAATAGIPSNYSVVYNADGSVTITENAPATIDKQEQ